MYWKAKQVGKNLSYHKLFLEQVWNKWSECWENSLSLFTWPSLSIPTSAPWVRSSSLPSSPAPPPHISPARASTPAEEPTCSFPHMLDSFPPPCLCPPCFTHIRHLPHIWNLPSSEWAHSSDTGLNQAEHRWLEEIWGLELCCFPLILTQTLIQVHILLSRMVSPTSLFHQVKFYFSFKAQLKWHLLRETIADFPDKIRACC